MKIIGKYIIFLIIVSVVIASTFGLTFAQKTTQAPVYKWRLQSTHAASDLSGVYLRPRLIEKLKEFSNGRIQLEYYHGGTLVPIPETLNALGRGVFDMSYSVGAYWQGTIPVGALEFGFPFAWSTPTEQKTMFYDKGILDVMREAYAMHGVRYLGAYSGGPMSLFLRNKPKNLNELRKLKIRSVGAFSYLLNKLKVSTVQITLPELYMALKLGTADGCVIGDLWWYDLKLPEVVKYYMQPSLVNPYVSNLLMNQKLWNELPYDIKQIVEHAVDDCFDAMYRQDAEATDIMVRKVVKEYGVEFFTLPPEDVVEMKKAAREIYRELAAKDKFSGRFVKILEDYKKFKGETE